MFETEIFGPCLVRKLKLGRGGGGMAPIALPVATPLIIVEKKLKKPSLGKTNKYIKSMIVTIRQPNDSPCCFNLSFFHRNLEMYL